MANTLEERRRRSARESAMTYRMTSAALAPPIGCERRLLKRHPRESLEQAIERAEHMPWWNEVIRELPQGDMRWWVWWVKEKENKHGDDQS